MPRRLIRRERSIEAACCKYAREKGCVVLKLTPPPRGIPDRLFLLPGAVSFFVEFKRPGGRLSPGQKECHAQLRRLGICLWIFDSTAAFKKYLDGRLSYR